MFIFVGSYWPHTPVFCLHVFLQDFDVLKDFYSMFSSKLQINLLLIILSDTSHGKKIDFSTSFDNWKPPN